MTLVRWSLERELTFLQEQKENKINLIIDLVKAKLSVIYTALS
jgi:hypothetical protein